MFNLATMYEAGKGVAMDEAEAVRWYRKAADAGIVEAMQPRARLYDQGRGTAKNPEEAARLTFEAIRGKDKILLAILKVDLDFFSDYSEAYRRALQRRLKEAGHYDGPPDGRLGPNMSRAIESLARQPSEPVP